MKFAIVLSLLAVSSTALAHEGYVESATGTVWRDTSGTCWHTGSWTAANAIPGCDGMPLTPPPPPPPPPAVMPPPPPPPPAVVAPLDTDKDGIVDDADKCADTPAGVAVDATGCPPDADADGVGDYLDKCANTPAGAVVDDAGCPKKLEHEVSINMDVNFVTAKADIQGDASNEIKKVATFMKQYPAVKVTIEGYTDNQGVAGANKKLSQKRADAVKAALVADGVDAARLTAIGFGADSPIADNKTEEGRAKNRRVVAHAKAETETIEMKKKPKK